jgi:hypothetical protein
MTHFLDIGPFAIVFIIGIVLLSLIISLIALVDILRSNFKGSNDKLIWVLIVLFLGFFGVLLYFIIGSEQKQKD